MDANMSHVTQVSAPRTTSTRTLVGRLNLEWVGLRADPVANATVASWEKEAPALDGLCTLDQIERAVAEREVHRVDAIFYALVVRAVGKGASAELAARTVLQLMLGKVVLIARAHASVLPDPEERMQLAVTCMYEAIRTFPVERRRHHVPPHLAWSTHAAVRRAVNAQAVEVPVGVLTTVASGATGPHPSEELAQVLAWAVAVGHLSRADADLLVARYGSEDGGNRTWKGLGDLDAVARRHGLSPASVKQRCSRARRRLAAVASEYLDFRDGGSGVDGPRAVTIHRCAGLPGR